MEFGLSTDDIVKILGTGISGLAFLFVALSYLLLRKEQDREGEPRGEMLHNINRFTWTTLIFALLVGSFTLIKSEKDSFAELPVACKEQLDRSRVLLESDQHNLQSMRQLLVTTLVRCDYANSASPAPNHE